MESPTEIEKVRPPRISVNKLADYLSTSSVTKRRGILREQKFPKDSEFKSTWYDEAKRPIKKCFATTSFKLDSASKMISKLQREIVELNSNYPEIASEIQKHKVKIQKKESCLEALELFLENINLLDKYKLNEFSPSSYAGSIEIKGVKISVEPDVIIRGEYRGKKYSGAVKLYFSKLNKLSADMGKTVSSMVYEHLKSFDEDANSKHCFVYDVINSTIYSASGSYSKRIKEIEMTCEDIHALWPAIQPK